MNQRKWGEALLAILLFLIVAGGMFGRSLPSDQLFVPMHTDEFLPWRGSKSTEEQRAASATSYTEASDKLISFRADDAVTVRGMRTQELPLWNRYNAGGVPHLGQGLYGVFYPFHAIYRWVDPERAYGILAALHHFLAALFTFFYLRAIGTRPLGAAVGGIAFGFSTCLLARAHYYQYIETYAWLPLGLFLVERWFRRRSRTSLFTLAPVTAIVLLSGWPQTAIFTIYTWIFCAIWNSARRELGIRPHKVLGAIALSAAFAGGASLFVDDPLLLIAFGPYVALFLIFATASNRGSFWRRMFALGSVMLLGIGIAMLQYLPVAEWGRHGARDLAAPETLIANALRPGFLADLFLPNIFGSLESPLRNTLHNLPKLMAIPQVDLFSGRLNHLGNPLENALYFGILPLFLLLVGVLFRSPRRGFLLFLLLLYGAFSIGLRYVVYPTYFGGFFVGADARRALVVAVFAACCLAGLGVSHLRHRPRVRSMLATLLLLLGVVALSIAKILPESDLLAPLVANAQRLADAYGEPLHFPDGVLEANATLIRGSLLHVGVALILGACALLLHLRRSLRGVGAIALVVVIAGDIGHASWSYLAPKPARGFLGPHPMIDRLQEEVGLSGRIAHYLDVKPEEMSPLLIPLPPNLSSAYGLLDAWCYTVTPPRRWMTLAQSIFHKEGDRFPPVVARVYVDPLSQPNHLDHPFLDLMAVRAVVGSRTLPDPLPAGFEFVGDFDGSWILRNRDALPRVFTVAGVEDANGYSDEKIVLSRLQAENFDPRRRVLLQGERVPKDDGFDRDALPTATFVEDEPERLRVQLEGGSSGGVLVVLDGFAPGWTATTDGDPADVLIADYAFRGIPFPAGTREIVLRYQPRSVAIGKWISAASLAVAALLMVVGFGVDGWSRRRRRLAFQSPSPRKVPAFVG